MKKFELVREVAKASGHSQEVVNAVIDKTCEIIAKTVVTDGDEVNLPALGKFKQKINPARKGINPLNKQPIDIKGSKTLSFRATSSLKQTIE